MPRAFAADEVTGANLPLPPSQKPAASSPSVSLRPDWKVGDKAYFRVQTGTLMRSADAEDVEIVATAIRSSEVISEDSRGHWVHRWRTEAYRVPALDNKASSARTAADPKASAAASSPRSRKQPPAGNVLQSIAQRSLQEVIQSIVALPTDVRVDGEGHVLEVANLPSIRDQMRQLYEPLLATPFSAHLSIRGFLDAILQNDAMLTQLLTEDSAFLYGPMGGTYEPGEVVDSIVDLPLRFVGGSVPAPGTMEVGPQEPDGTVSVSVVIDLPFEQLVAAMSEGVSSASSGGSEPQVGEAMLSVLRSERWAVRMDQTFLLRSGEAWPVKFRQQTRMSGDAPQGRSEQVRSVRITRLAELPNSEKLLKDRFKIVPQ